MEVEKQSRLAVTKSALRKVFMIQGKLFRKRSFGAESASKTLVFDTVTLGPREELLLTSFFQQLADLLRVLLSPHVLSRDFSFSVD